MQHRKVKNMIFISLGAVLMAVGAWITLPFPIPFTMQTFVIYLLLSLFGSKIGMCSILLYIALGIAGIPVFSGFNSGISALLGPSGGFILGFAAVGCAYLALQPSFSKNKYLSNALPFITLTLCYACGTAWYMLYTNTAVGIVYAVAYCVLPYIIPDCIKIVLALLVSKRLKKIISV